MQPSHRVATAMASAISSLVLVSSALAFKAACAMAEKPCMTAGAPPRSSFRAADRSLVVWTQFLFMVLLRVRGRHKREAGGSNLHLQSCLRTIYESIINYT